MGKGILKRKRVTRERDKHMCVCVCVCARTHPLHLHSEIAPSWEGKEIAQSSWAHVQKLQMWEKPTEFK